MKGNIVKLIILHQCYISFNGVENLGDEVTSSWRQEIPNM